MQLPQDNRSPASGTDRNVKLGIGAMFAEVVSSMLIVTAVKLVAGDVSVAVILLYRYAFSLPALLVQGLVLRGRRIFAVAKVRILALRTIFGLIGLSTWILAISHIALAKATAIGQTLPLFITVLAPLLLGEKVGIRRRIAVAVGLLGTLIILRPDRDGWLQIGTVYAVLAPFFAALMFIMLRKLGQSETPVTTAIWYNLVGFAVFALLCLAVPMSWPDTPLDIALLVTCGALSSVQQYLMALSHKLAPASTLAPIHYIAVPISIVIGFFLFDETISLSFVAGTAVIIASTYFILMRERKIREQGR